MSESLNFDSAEPVSIPVTIAGEKYLLREASESVATEYRNAQLMAMQVNESAEGNKIARVGRVIDTESMLVSKCLFKIEELDGKETEKPVPLQQVKNWPHRISHKLFKTAEQISNLGKEETREELIKQKKDIDSKLKKLETQDVTDPATSIQELDAKNS